MVCEGKRVQGFSEDIGPVVVGRHVDYVDLAEVVQLAHLVDLAVDVARMLPRCRAVAEVVSASIVSTDLHRK